MGRWETMSVYMDRYLALQPLAHLWWRPGGTPWTAEDFLETYLRVALGAELAEAPELQGCFVRPSKALPYAWSPYWGVW